MSIKRFIRNVYLILRTVLFTICFIFTFRMRKKISPQTNINKILVIGLKRVGDNIASIPIFRAIKEKYPKAELVVLTSEYIKDMLEEIEYIDRPLVLETKGLSSFLKLISNIRGESFDLAIDLTCDYTFFPALLIYLSKAKYSIGYNISGRGFLFNLPVFHSKKPIHAIEEILNIVKGIGIDAKDKQPRVSVSEGQKESVRQLQEHNNIRDNDLLVGVHPGGHYPSQRWPKERFAEVADAVMQKYSAKIILIGDSREADLIEYIKSKMENEPVVFLNQPLKKLIALINRCDLLVCNNSGLLHIAVAVNTPTVSTMGPTDSTKWWPRGENNIVLKKDLSCLGCGKGFCRGQDCMNLITVSEMLEAIEIQIKKIKK